MSVLDPWEKRPTEEANLFNPAFVGSLIYEFVKTYERSKSEGVPLTYIPLALAISLHRPTRLRLPSRTVTSLYEWVQNNEDVLVGLHNRVTGLLPYVREAIQFSMYKRTLQMGQGHFLQLGDTKAHFPSNYLSEATPDVAEAIKRTQFLARWFVKSGSEPSILACWGVRP